MTMLARELRAGAVLVLAVLGSVGCSFKDDGFNSGSAVESDADGLPGGTGGGSGGGGTGGGPTRFDGSTGVDLAPGSDGPPPIAGDALAAGDLPGASPDAPGLPIGSMCSADGACGSGFCVDGVCCESRCGEPCVSCGGSNGGTGAGVCRPDPANTVCGSPSCSGSTLTPAPRCDGNGACGQRPAAACAGSLTCASGTACKTRCAANTDCTGGTICDVAAGTCRPPGKPNGQACATGDDCLSGNCADKVCCDLPCSASCRSCLAAQTGRPDGTCGNIMAGMKDPACVVQEVGTCGRNGTCDGSGRCATYPDGTTCGTGCCRDDSGPGSGRSHPCRFQCSNGICNRSSPTFLDRCGGFQCCCPMPTQGGGPMCTGTLGCPLGMCVP